MKEGDSLLALLFNFVLASASS